MTTRIIRITECTQCPANLKMQGATYCQEYYDGGGMRPTPPTGTPAWCPLEQASERKEGNL